VRAISVRRVPARSCRDLHAIAIGIEHDGLVVTIAGAARTVDDRVAIGPQRGGQLVDPRLRANADREVRQTETLAALSEASTSTAG
jgi:hypothetical protein